MSLPLTNADTMRTIRLVGAVMSALAAEKVFDFWEFLGATRRIRTDDLGATRRIRTDDLLITNQLLYQLS